MMTSDICVEGSVSFKQPVRYCKVHGEIRDGCWVNFYIGNVVSPSYCLRCAMELFEKLGVSIVTEIP